MQFRIADTFTSSLTRLTGEEQRAVKTTAFDLQINPANPGHSYHKLDHARDKRFWSVRASRDIRIIVHRSDQALLLCYVDHHDKAYAWAERRKLETHPTTGAAQLVEIRETVREIAVPMVVHEPISQPPPKPAIFANQSMEALLNLGVPPDWVDDVLQVDEDGLLAMIDRLPSEAMEALLQLATGGRPDVKEPAPVGASPFDHPDARRRFKLVATAEELQRALEFPWEKWAVFLHPDQQELVNRDFHGPARVAGSAGTGKTVVALHRAAHLARNHADARVLLTTFSDTLADFLSTKLRLLVANEPRLLERIEVHSLPAFGRRLYERHIGPVQIVSPAKLEETIAAAVRETGVQAFSKTFLLTEWEQVVDAWQLKSWETYRDVARLGRKVRLPESQRAQLWEVFARVADILGEQNLLTEASVFGAITQHVASHQLRPFDFTVVDEAQDLSVSQLRFLAAMGGDQTNSLFFAGDLGQRIFQPLFSWKALGVDIRGRSRTLRVNYRTSHQIRRQADLLLDPEIADADGNRESRGETVSVFTGPAPVIQIADNQEAERRAVVAWLKDLALEGIRPEEIAVFVRSDAEFPRTESALKEAGTPYRLLHRERSSSRTGTTLSTMHLAKGLEFRAVAIMACDDDVIPLQSRISTAAEPADLEEVYHTERHLLYVACTRARDHLLITAISPGSEFLEDMVPKATPSQ